MPYRTGNSAHDAAVLTAENTYQAAIAGVSTQSAAKAIDIARLQAIIASGDANGISVLNARVALRSLQSTGSA